MIPAQEHKVTVSHACPHTRGDDPIRSRSRRYSVALVPIRVGMILFDTVTYGEASACPHTRGDDPRYSRKNA